MEKYLITCFELDNCMPRKTRRDVIRSVAIGAGVGSGLVTPALGEQEKNSEVIDEIIRLHRKSRMKKREAKHMSESEQKYEVLNNSEEFKEKATKLLEEHDIEHRTFKDEYGHNDQISVQDKRYAGPDKKDSTEITLDTYNSDEKVTVQVSWSLIEHGDWLMPDNTCPPDGVAIYWNQNHWQATSTGRDNFKNSWADAINADGTGETNYDEYDIKHGGVLAKVKDPAPTAADGKTAEFWGGFGIDLNPVTNNASEYPIKAKYKHTWQQTGCIWKDLGISLSAGAISVDGGKVDDWTMSTDGTI